MLSAEGAGLAGVGALACEVELQEDSTSFSTLTPLAELYEPAVGLFPASDPQPLANDSFADFSGAAAGIANGLEAIGNWAGQIGNQSIPGADQITINAPNLNTPDLTRSINFFHAQVLPGGLYQLSIDGSLYEVMMGGVLGTASIEVVEVQDTNGNGVPDDWELNFYDALEEVPENVIKQGREYTLMQVFTAGVSPLDDAWPAWGQDMSGWMIATVAGRTYRIERSENILNSDGWVEWGEEFVSDGSPWNPVVPADGFYRFVVYLTE